NDWKNCESAFRTEYGQLPFINKLEANQIERLGLCNCIEQLCDLVNSAEFIDLVTTAAPLEDRISFILDELECETFNTVCFEKYFDYVDQVVWFNAQSYEYQITPISLLEY